MEGERACTGGGAELVWYVSYGSNLSKTRFMAYLEGGRVAGNDVVYEGCFGDAPQSYRGETGAQSSIVPTMLMALGIRHKNSLLTKHLEDMQTYMPTPHRQFIRAQVSVRDFVVGAPRLKEWYNACVAELIAFRKKHFEYAVNYIEKKVDNPIATGGTPYVPWLRQLIEETKEYYV